MKIDRGFGHSAYPYITVLVDSNELRCTVKTLPYSTWLGTIRLDNGKINAWGAPAYRPRGYNAARDRVLAAVQEVVLRRLKADTLWSVTGLTMADDLIAELESVARAANKGE